jgi:hypothetical protein
MSQKKDPGVKHVETLGLDIAMAYFEQRGYKPRRLGHNKGHDIELDKGRYRRIEVKATTHQDRAWCEASLQAFPDCRKVRSDRRHIAFERSETLPFDDVLEVTDIGKPGGPHIYYYPARLASKFGKLDAKPVWKWRVPMEIRDHYKGHRRRR